MCFVEFLIPLIFYLEHTYGPPCNERTKHTNVWLRLHRARDRPTDDDDGSTDATSRVRRRRGPRCSFVATNGRYQRTTNGIKRNKSVIDVRSCLHPARISSFPSRSVGQVSAGRIRRVGRSCQRSTSVGLAWPHWPSSTTRTDLDDRFSK